MTDRVYTSWHKVMDAIKARQIIVPSHFHDRSLDLNRLNEIVHQFDLAPKFVVDPHLTDMLGQDENMFKTICDMKKADSINFPFPLQVVQFPIKAAVMDANDKVISHHYIQAFILMGMLEGTIVATCLYWDPKREGVIIGYHEGIVNIPDDANKPWMWTAQRHRAYREVVPQYERVNSNDQISVRVGLTCLLVLTHTEGIEREVIKCGKINKIRKKSGKTLIPDITYIHIGRVYRADGTSETWDERRPTRVHWRRGHNRRVAVGKGRMGREWRYIKPCLVNYVEGDDKPKATTHVVTW